jgi:hypothetical protein
MPGIPHEWTSNACPPVPVPQHERPEPWQSRDAKQKGYRDCYCGAYEPYPHRWFPPDQGGRCPVLYVPAPDTPTQTEPGYVADVYSGGGKREENGDRPRFDLLWTESQPLERQMLHRDAVWAQKAAKKYGERNWERFEGEAELVRAQASLGRHHAAFMLGMTDEDHAAAIRSNVQFIEYIRERLAEPDPSQEGPF